MWVFGVSGTCVQVRTVAFANLCVFFKCRRTILSVLNASTSHFRHRGVRARVFDLGLLVVRRPRRRVRVQDCSVVGQVWAGLRVSPTARVRQQVDQRGSRPRPSKAGSNEKVVASRLLEVIQVGRVGVSVRNVRLSISSGFIDRSLRCVVEDVTVVQVGGTCSVAQAAFSALIRNVVGPLIQLQRVVRPSLGREGMFLCSVRDPIYEAAIGGPMFGVHVDLFRRQPSYLNCNYHAVM